MVYFGFKFWPFNGKSGLNDIFLFARKMSTNKFLEIQFLKYDYLHYLFEFELNTNFTGRDHAGIMFSVGVWKYDFIFNLYDTRHWDYENDCWEE